MDDIVDITCTEKENSAEQLSWSLRCLKIAKKRIAIDFLALNDGGSQ